MPPKKNLPLLLVAFMLMLAACVQPPPTPIATPFPPTATPIPTASPEPSADPDPTATPEPVLEPEPADPNRLPNSTIFDIPWDERSVFTPGLIADEQSALELRPGASVYHIDLNIADDLATLTGREEVRYTNTEDVPLDEIYFRLFPNLADGRSQISNLTANLQPIEPRYELEDSVMIAPLPEPLQPGEQVVFGMDMAIEVPTEGGGNYGTFALMDDILALAHFYPMIAVYDDEGWNVEIAPPEGDVVFSDTSYYLAQVKAPAGQVILSSGIEIGREQQDGRQSVAFAAGPMRDFYLVSSDRYEAISQQVGETTINAYAPPEVAAENELALRYATDALRVYNERFGVYPFTELDVVGTPTLAGGVEYPGLVVVALNIYDENYPFFEAATAHEVGHQWFYSVVGNDQIDEPWLDESLTQYATLLYYKDVYGQAVYDAARAADMQRRWDNIDEADIPIGLPVSAYSENGTYSGIIYGRGPLFFETLATALGEETFDAFIKDYTETFKWDIATTEGLKALAEKHCQCDLTPLFEEWVFAKRGLG